MGDIDDGEYMVGNIACSWVNVKLHVHSFDSYSQRIGNTYFVGNNSKRQISKRVFQENKARQVFRKINISYPLRLPLENLKM